MKKRKIAFIIPFCILFVFLLALLGYLFLFDTTGLVYWDKSDGVAFFSSDNGKYYIVSETGNCYLAGTLIDDDNRYGVKDIRKFHNAPADNYVRIYDKGDAEKMHLNLYGGTITTKNHTVYLFINSNDHYRVPTLFAEGYKDAYLGNDVTVWLLKENGDLGYIDLNRPDGFHRLKQNIKEFCYVDTKHENGIFALSNDNLFYSIILEETAVKFESVLDKVSDFDSTVSFGDTYILSILDTDGNAYSTVRTHLLHLNRLNDFDHHKGNKNVSVASYNEGIGMLRENGDVAVAGTEVGLSTIAYDGEIMFKDVKKIFGGDNSFAIVKNDGTFMLFGLYPDASGRVKIKDYAE